MNDDKIIEDIKKFRIQARSQVIVLISSLILIFLWFSNFSWVTKQETFSSMALQAAARASGMKSHYVIPLTFFVTILFTIFYIILIKVLISSSIDESRKLSH